MPIIRPPQFKVIGQEVFSDIAYQVRKAAFDSQNALGRLQHETIYQNDIFERLGSMGYAVAKEVPVMLTHGNFEKSYKMDLLVADSVIVELKTLAALGHRNNAQLLNYLFLCGSHHGSLINLRPPSVEARFVNTTLELAQRRMFRVDLDHWQENDDSEGAFKDSLCSLIGDWGTRLELSLYREAIIHFLGGVEHVRQSLPISRQGLALGKQEFDLISPGVAFKLTALSEGFENYARHLKALLRSSPLRSIHWVNFNSEAIRFSTLTR